MVVGILAAALLLRAAPAEPAKAPAPKAEPAAASAKAKPEKRCTMERVTGSTLKTRVCRTPEEEAQALAAARAQRDRNEEQIDEGGRVLPGF